MTECVMKFSAKKRHMLLKVSLSLQVSQFVSSDDDTGEAASVLDNGHRVDFLEPLVDDAGAPDVGEPSRAPVALTVARFAPAHVQPKMQQQLIFCDGSLPGTWNGRDIAGFFGHLSPDPCFDNVMRHPS